MSRPVIAPRKGLIPMTIVDGVNGWTYSDNQEMIEVIKMSSTHIDLVRGLMREKANQSVLVNPW